MYEKYVELLESMQIPFIETIILARLEEFKALAREEIKTFKSKKKK